MRKAEDQMRRMSQSALFASHRRRGSPAIFPAMTTRARVRHGVYPLLWMRLVFWWRWTRWPILWELDAGAFIETCQKLPLPFLLERSRSGKVVIFGSSLAKHYSESARNLGSIFLLRRWSDVQNWPRFV